jgi:hypothetical protein
VCARGQQQASGSGRCATVGRSLCALGGVEVDVRGIGPTFTYLALSLVLELFLFLFLFCQLFLTLFVTVVGCCQVVLSSSYEDFNILQVESGAPRQVLSLIRQARLGCRMMPPYRSPVGMPAGMAQPGTHQHQTQPPGQQGDRDQASD